MIVEDGGGRVRREPVNYPSNSNKSKAATKAKPVVEKVTTGEVVVRKKPLHSRISESIVAESGSTVGEYIVMDVIVPAVKTLISDMVSQGVNKLLFGDGVGRRMDTRPGYTSYNKVSRPSGYVAKSEMSRQDRAVHNFENIILRSREDAELVLEQLQELISQYQQAKVSDLYELVGEDANFTDDTWGWTNLSAARIRPVRGGYLFDFPRPVPLVE